MVQGISGGGGTGVTVAGGAEVWVDENDGADFNEKALAYQNAKVIRVPAGNYTNINATLIGALGKTTVIKGAGRDITVLNGQNGVPAITLKNGVRVILEDIQVKANTGAGSYAIWGDDGGLDRETCCSFSAFNRLAITGGVSGSYLMHLKNPIVWNMNNIYVKSGDLDGNNTTGVNGIKLEQTAGATQPYLDGSIEGNLDISIQGNNAIGLCLETADAATHHGNLIRSSGRIWMRNALAAAPTVPALKLNRVNWVDLRGIQIEHAFDECILVDGCSHINLDGAMQYMEVNSSIQGYAGTFFETKATDHTPKNIIFRNFYLAGVDVQYIIKDVVTEAHGGTWLDGCWISKTTANAEQRTVTAQTSWSRIRYSGTPSLNWADDINF